MRGHFVNDPFIQALVMTAGVLTLTYLILIILIAILRRALWLFSGIFFLIDEFMWFLYNPLRPLMRNKEGKMNRVGFFLFSMLLVKPLWQLSVWILTTPLRFVTALYFDVLMYLFVMLSDSVDELFHPKLGKMRHRKGLDYWWRWLIGFPIRLVWLLWKNSLAILDSFLMFFVSLVWPTFTMYHGTPRDAAFDISQKGRWLVGGGNWGGSGVYFGRSVKIARHYAGSRSSSVADQRIIIARVSFSMLRNCATLLQSKRQHVGKMGQGGVDLAKSIKFPFYATELWRDGTKWWEYCILFGNKPGEFVTSWRIRAIGFVQLKGQSNATGTLERLWGGKSHYCLSLPNIIVGGLSAGASIWLISLVR